MPELKTWRVRDGAGTPDPTADPQFLAFVDRSGGALTPRPLISHQGLGEFGFRANASQENLGAVYLIDNGPTALSRYEFGAVYESGTLPISTLCFFNPDGSLWSGGGSPVMQLPVPPAGPSPVNLLGGYLWCIFPSQADIDAGGYAYVVDAPSGALPDSYDGALVGIPRPAPVVTPGGTVVEVLGVLETGAARASNVPLNVRKTLAVVAGMSLTLRFRCVKPDGSSVIGGTFDFGVSKRTGDSFRPIKKNVTALSVVDFTVAPNETKSMSAGLYAWDVWYTDTAGSRSPVMPPSPFKLENAVTPPP